MDFTAPKSKYLKRFYITLRWAEKYYGAYFNENCLKKGQKWLPVLQLDIKCDMECQKAVGSITRNQCECGVDHLKMVGYRAETKYGNLSTEKAEL